jgi:catechol 2,3-dioxygenase-like lactoylglutathione lyase family enzyme
MSEIEGVVETALYVPDLDQAESFYHGVLGLPVIGKEPGRHVFFRVGAASVLLVFLPEVTLKGGVLPAHGGRGPGHVALGVKTEALERWRERLRANDVPVEQEVNWPRGGRSIYFRDPAGNSVELLTPGLWGLPSGW